MFGPIMAIDRPGNHEGGATRMMSMSYEIHNVADSSPVTNLTTKVHLQQTADQRDFIPIKC